MLKKSALILTALAVDTLLPASAEAAYGVWGLTPAVVSQYMFRGVRRGGPSFEPTIEYDYGSLAVGVWANFPLMDKVVGQSDPEFDFYGSYTVEVVKDAVSLAPGVTIYTYPNAM